MYVDFLWTAVTKSQRQLTSPPCPADLNYVIFGANVSKVESILQGLSILARQNVQKHFGRLAANQ